MLSVRVSENAAVSQGQRSPSVDVNENAELPSISTDPQPLVQATEDLDNMHIGSASASSLHTAVPIVSAPVQQSFPNRTQASTGLYTKEGPFKDKHAEGSVGTCTSKRRREVKYKLDVSPYDHLKGLKRTSVSATYGSVVLSPERSPAEVPTTEDGQSILSKQPPLLAATEPLGTPQLVQQDEGIVEPGPLHIPAVRQPATVQDHTDVLSLLHSAEDNEVKAEPGYVRSKAERNSSPATNAAAAPPPQDRNASLAARLHLVIDLTLDSDSDSGSSTSRSSLSDIPGTDAWQSTHALQGYDVFQTGKLSVEY